MWLSYEIKRKKEQSLKLCQNTKKKEIKGVYVDIDQDLILAGVQYEIGWKWEKRIGSQNIFCLNKNKIVQCIISQIRNVFPLLNFLIFYMHFSIICRLYRG